MRNFFLKSLPYSILIAVSVFALVTSIYSRVPAANAEGMMVASNEHLVTIHDRDTKKTILTKQNTLRNVFKEAGITIDKNDIVEPGLDEKLISTSYQVNVYRARPVTIIDGTHHIRINSAFRTPQQIAQAAGITLQDEDKTTISLSKNVVADGASLMMKIDRATPVNLVLYGKEELVYTQAKTIADFLKEKSIVLSPKDTLSVKQSQAISSDMKVEIWRNGKQTVTQEEQIVPPQEIVQDANQKVGYEKITDPGEAGKKSVTYEIVMKNGKEVSRTMIQNVIIKAAKKQIKIVGSKPSFGGDFASALAKLRSCEGGYGSWNSAGPYYGAYQFDQGTWRGVSSAPYGSATPAQQDAAARALYERRGWSPWPVCGSSLPDTYR